ncbi:MAG: hypothetical protein IKZ30_05165 [Oscillospiraceae bacterium]|nr:hypothetical protein [Oscillospiraceae bacterium]
MSLEAISSITVVEDNIRQMKADAAAKAKRDIAAAEKNGQDAVAAAVKKAEDEISELVRKAETKATADASELNQSTENKKAAMRVKAESEMNKAAALIVERIVNS